MDFRTPLSDFYYFIKFTLHTTLQLKAKAH